MNRKRVLRRVGWTTTLVGLVVLSTGANVARGEDDYKTLGGGVKYEAAGEYSVERCNQILTSELAEFSSFPIAYPAAKNAVRLYRVVYPTVVPEQNNRPLAVSGLIAVPQPVQGTVPIVSYQHGTVFSRSEVPSSPEESSETRLMIANFAAQGYVVIAADYVGKGVSNEGDAFVVKDATAQACLDMLSAARAVCADLHVPTGELFLSGWSQGAYNTLVFLRKLETLGMPVKATALAATPSDVYLLVNRLMNVSSELDVHWVVGVICLLVNSYEHYYGLPGLSQAAIKPEYWQAARDLYENKITWTEAEKRLPFKTKDLLTESFVASGSVVGNRFFRQLQENEAYCWRAKTPARLYYGQIDEVVAPHIATLPVKYQETMGGASMEAVFAGEKADHRAAFLFGIKDQKAWFDSLRALSGPSSAGRSP